MSNSEPEVLLPKLKIRHYLVNIQILQKLILRVFHGTVGIVE